MSKMIERVAKAITVSINNYEADTVVAKAAITAMLEPTDEMVEATGVHPSM